MDSLEDSVEPEKDSTQAAILGVNHSSTATFPNQEQVVPSVIIQGEVSPYSDNAYINGALKQDNRPS